MKVKELIWRLNRFDPNLDVKVIAENGLHLSPVLKHVLKDPYDLLNHGKENIKYLVIHYD